MRPALRLAPMREAASCPRPAATLRRGLCVLLALLSTGAGAETAVSGSISADTTWTTQNAPYRLSGVVSIDSGARLTINPGVKLLMEGGCISARGECLGLYGWA